MLLDLGFEPAGHWKLEDGSLRCALHAFADTSRVLYAFMLGDEVMYIGKSTMTLRKRMYGYERPGTSQRTNVRNNSYIHEKLEGKQQIEVFVFPPLEKQMYRGYTINVAAGLEDSVIERFQPKWNISGKIQES